ncbi:uncharacterized protein BX664DRAFT_309854 [Halteromyces radiatus]|uniref:uncharacterized protein n=1 Tax=Halteromyces radiatus TaxID=101107 RepID=UPI0022200404|nr:uncharacterized protein BX664DRAFT_309854 [Halteromyces radiatus]KAI8098815.1 hypothetical protein BX664DRAFT_309854 [Halteromyces radiatus]
MASFLSSSTSSSLPSIDTSNYNSKERTKFTKRIFSNGSITEFMTKTTLVTLTNLQRTVDKNYDRIDENINHQKLNQLSRKNAVDHASMTLWMEYLNNRNYITLHVVYTHNGKKKFMDWCIDSTRQACKSMTKGDDKYETLQLLDATRIKLNDMMHAVSSEIFDLFQSRYKTDFSEFYTYFKTYYWNAVFHTNKFTIILATKSIQLTQPGWPYLDIDKKKLLNERIRQF